MGTAECWDSSPLKSVHWISERYQKHQSLVPPQTLLGPRIQTSHLFDGFCGKRFFLTCGFCVQCLSWQVNVTLPCKCTFTTVYIHSKQHLAYVFHVLYNYININTDPALILRAVSTTFLVASTYPFSPIYIIVAQQAAIMPPGREPAMDGDA